jgi:hypothetical protein
LTYLQNFFTAHSAACGKKPNAIEMRDQVMKNSFFGSVPKSQKCERKFSGLGTLKGTVA